MKLSKFGLIGCSAYVLLSAPFIFLAFQTDPKGQIVFMQIALAPVLVLLALFRSGWWIAQTSLNNCAVIYALNLLLAYLVGYAIQSINLSAKKRRLENYVEEREAKRAHDHRRESGLSKF